MGGACSIYGERKGVYWILVGKPEGKNHVEEPSVDGRIILQCFTKKWNGGMNWIELAQDRHMAGSCEYGNEPSVSIKCGKILG
jgi:hypothetical protein